MPTQSKQLKLSKRRDLHIDEIKPYWRNPRRVPVEAVNALMESIRSFGYQQPIVVDNDNVIIIGHTRYAALRKLGVEELSVVVAGELSPDKVKQLRVLDNKVAEATTWDFEVLMEELEIIDSELIVALFPEKISDEDFDKATETFTAELEEGWSQVVNQVEFVCPSCFHSWETHVDRESVMKGIIETKPEEVSA